MGRQSLLIGRLLYKQMLPSPCNLSRAMNFLLDEFAALLHISVMQICVHNIHFHEKMLKSTWLCCSNNLTYSTSNFNNCLYSYTVSSPVATWNTWPLSSLRPA